MHALGDEIGPNSNDPNAQPRFNRPEDAEGFLRSQGALAEPGVDADEDTKRRQREELMYWNAVRLENLKKKEAKGKAIEDRPQGSRGSSFEDFLQEEEGAEKGTTFVLQSTGADVKREDGLRQRKGIERGSAWANPFSDEHGIESSQESGIITTDKEGEKYEILSQGLYSAHDSPSPAPKATIDQLVDTSDPPISLPDTEEEYSAWNSERSRSRTIPIQSPTPEAEAAFASIHAWADQANASASFYSPLPTTPRALSPAPSQQPLHLSVPNFTGEEEFDDPPESVPGDLTPTDSMSVVDGTDVGEVWGPRSGATSEFGVERQMDVMSVADSEFDGEGIHTPSSWSEVASVVSEADGVAH